MYWIKKYCAHIWVSVIPKQHICSKLSLVTFYIPLKAGVLRGTACTSVSFWLFAKGVIGAGSVKGTSFPKAGTVSTFSLFSCFFDATFLVTGVDNVHSVSSSWESGLECYRICNEKKKAILYCILITFRNSPDKEILKQGKNTIQCLTIEQ